MHINKNRWSRFCKTISATNQYRPAIMSLKSKGSDEYEVSQTSLFTGILLKRKGRRVSGVELFCDQPDPDRLLVPVISVEKPVEIALHQSEDGEDEWLTIEGEDETVASIMFCGPADSQQRYACVEKLAYAFSERRGFVPGGNLKDWFNAERAIKEAELHLVQ